MKGLHVYTHWPIELASSHQMWRWVTWESTVWGQSPAWLAGGEKDGTWRYCYQAEPGAWQLAKTHSGSLTNHLLYSHPPHCHLVSDAQLASTHIKKITYMYVKDNILLYKIEWSKYPFFHGVRYLGTFSPTCAMLSLSSAFTEDAKTKQQSSWDLVCTIQNKPAGSKVAQTAHAQWT